MKLIPDDSVDLCVTDPAYRTISGGRKVNDGQPSGILLSNNGKIFGHNNIAITDWMKEVYRILKNDTHFYTMTNVLNMTEMLNVAESIGFRLHNILIWKKNNCTPSQYYMKNAEYILFFRKGRAKYINNIGTKTVIEIDNVKNRVHPTQKPLGLMKILIENSSRPNDLILDPFMGSGSTAVAAKLCGRNWIGFELDMDYINISMKRLAEATAADET